MPTPTPPSPNQPFSEPRLPSVDDKDISGEVADGIALSLSGGGYRAMVFHVGVLWRLNDMALLSKIDRFSSVSGGSITAALLGLKWNALLEGEFSRDAFVSQIVEPIQVMASKDIDVRSILKGIFLPGTIADKVANE